MHPYFHILGLTFRYYDFLLLMGELIIVAGSVWLAKKNGLPRKQLIIILLSVAVATLAGSRILHVLTNIKTYRENPDLIFNFDFQGQSMYGGLILAIIVGFILCRHYKIDYWSLGDYVAPSLGFGLAVIRIGCFLNGCCYGIETNLPWGVRFPILSPAHRRQLTDNLGSLFNPHPVHPTELYEACLGFFLGLLAIYLLKKKLPKGTVILSMGLVYSLYRLATQSLRADPVITSVPDYFYPLLYLLFIIVLLILISTRFKYVRLYFRENELK